MTHEAFKNEPETDFTLPENADAFRAAIDYYLGASVAGTVQFEITDISGQRKRTYSVDAAAGIGRLLWDMRYDPGSEDCERFTQEL